MGDIIKNGGNEIVGLIHGKNGELDIPKPFQRDIFLFDTYVAGTIHVDGIEELEPGLNVGDRIDFFRERTTLMIQWRSPSRIRTELR